MDIYINVHTIIRIHTVVGESSSAALFNSDLNVSCVCIMVVHIRITHATVSVHCLASWMRYESLPATDKIEPYSVAFGSSTIYMFCRFFFVATNETVDIVDFFSLFCFRYLCACLSFSLFFTILSNGWTMLPLFKWNRSRLLFIEPNGETTCRVTK